MLTNEIYSATVVLELCNNAIKTIKWIKHTKNIKEQKKKMIKQTNKQNIRKNDKKRHIENQHINN